MVTKHTPEGREYEIENGRYLVWHADVWEDEGETPFDVRLPLRMKAGILFDISGTHADIDLGAMKAIFEAIAPTQIDATREMDVNDFQVMFTTWQSEYESLNGATLGEVASSPA